MTPDQPPLPDNKKPLLNLFALPQQTTILATLIVLVIYAVLLAISAGTPPVTFWPLLLIVLLLSVRSLLAWPERYFYTYLLAPAGEQFAPLEQRIQELGTEIGLKPVPHLVITPENAKIATFGSFQRRYIIAGASFADALQQDLCDPGTAASVEAVLLHELHHFQQGDNLQIGYIRSLLRVSVKAMLWAMLFLIGLFSFLIIVKDFILTTSPAEMVERYEETLRASGIPGVDLPSDLFMSEEEWQELRAGIEETDYGLVVLYALTNTLGILLISLFLASFIWYKLLRMREYYADAKVAHVQKTITPLMQAPLGGIGSKSSTRENASFAQRAQEALKSAMKSLPIAYFFRPSPSNQERLNRLKDPATVYDTSWKLGLFIGGYVSLLWFLLANTALYYVGSWPLHFPVLTMFILISLALIVRHVQNINVRRESLYIVGIALIPLTALLIFILAILWLGFFLMPDLLSDFLNAAVSVVARYAGTSQEDLFSSDMTSFMIGASIINVIQIPVMFLVIYLSVLIQSRLTQRILAWYSFPRAERYLMRVIYASITLLAVVLSFGILPIISSLILPSHFGNWLSPLFWLSIGASVIVVLLAGVWFWQQDQRYARKCPHCETTIPEPHYYEAGQTCPSCGHVLHPWLLADYETDAPR